MDYCLGEHHVGLELSVVFEISQYVRMQDSRINAEISNPNIITELSEVTGVVLVTQCWDAHISQDGAQMSFYINNSCRKQRSMLTQDEAHAMTAQNHKSFSSIIFCCAHPVFLPQPCKILFGDPEGVSQVSRQSNVH